jgi:hypothetical protein
MRRINVIANVEAQPLRISPPPIRQTQPTTSSVIARPPMILGQTDDSVILLISS